MKTNYRGYDIEVKRERAMGGWDFIGLYVYRASDGLEVICEQTSGEDTVTTLMNAMKYRVDEFIKSNGASELLEDEY